MLDFQAIIDSLEDEFDFNSVQYTSRYQPRNAQEAALKQHCGSIVNDFCTQFDIKLDAVKLHRKTESYGHTLADYYKFYRNRKTGRFSLQLQQVNSCQELVTLLTRLFSQELTWTSRGQKITPFPKLELIDQQDQLHAELSQIDPFYNWAQRWLAGRVYA